jgi:hypothetical protein
VEDGEHRRPLEVAPLRVGPRHVADQAAAPGVEDQRQVAGQRAIVADGDHRGEAVLVDDGERGVAIGGERGRDVHGEPRRRA